MRRCECDPRWITVRFEGICVRCKRPIHPAKRLLLPRGSFPLLRCRGVRQGGEPRFLGAGVRRGEQHFVVRSEGHVSGKLRTMRAEGEK